MSSLARLPIALSPIALRKAKAKAEAKVKMLRSTMKLTALLSFFLLLALPAGCTGNPVFVTPTGLGQGGGGNGVSSAPTLDIVIVMGAPSTGFNPENMLRVMINGVERTDEVLLGGSFGVLPMDPAPAPGNPQFVELFRRAEPPLLDSFTWTTQTYMGPTIASVAPDTAEVGMDVTITGAGLDTATARVFFGGAEGTVTGVAGTSLTATVPADAIPGLVYVLIGSDAAEGIVEFQPLDSMQMPIPTPTSGRTIFAAFPARGPTRTALRIYGLGFGNATETIFNGQVASTVINTTTQTMPLTGDMLNAFAVVGRSSPLGAGTWSLQDDSGVSNSLPFTVE